MSNDLNLCQFIGRAGKDPEVRYTSGGDAVCNFSIAASQSWKDKTTGEKKEKTEWVNCSAFGKLAEIVGEYVKKGKQVYVAGRMETRKWQDKDGADRYTTEIRVDQLQLLGGKDA
jgi:single-strand DNA-binding protein